MLNRAEFELKLNRILPTVQKPGRYYGGELNQVVKPWDSVKTRVCLAFPDIYDLGLPNLGLAILYESLNQREDVLAERTYIPWLDMEEAMRAAEMPLYSLESRHPVAEFDLLGISLPYESLYTNTLNLLDLAGIPLRSAERDAIHPIVLAGGHSTTNPEPMADFIDAFVIGEGEEVIHEVVNAIQAAKTAGLNRADTLRKLAAIPGIYVPCFYHPEYHPDGRVKQITPLEAGIPAKVTKRIVGRLPEPPTHFIVPNIDVVHNRVSVEIMRGCTRGCRFCHAGFITRPVRERPVDEIITAIENALDNTGFEEIALLSLSSSDYTHIQELVSKLAEHFSGRHLTISLPSLRIESLSIDLLETLRGSRSGGFTLAPEAATERMRNLINKPIPSEDLIAMAREIYSRGWPTLKLYFMIGHPDETLEDVQEIARLCKAVLLEGKRAIGNRASLHAGVSTFVPKAHTPFQWTTLDSPEQIAAKQQILRSELRIPGMKVNWSDNRETQMEAWLSRGDRRLGQVIYTAWKNGAKFDAWQDQYRYETWLDAFAQAGLDPDFYAYHTRAEDEVFPWDHIFCGVRKSHLLEEYQMGLRGETRADCREGCYACGILPTFNQLRQANPGASWKCPEVPASQA